VNRASRYVATLGRTAHAHLARRIQRGSRVIVWTPAGLGFGNFLYLWLRAHALQQRGIDCRVLYVPEMEPWLASLPHVREELVIRPEQVRPWDQRDRAWNQSFGVDFEREDLHRFIRSHLLASPLVGESPTPSPSAVTVNIRRGDYYSTPELRGRYSFDITAYLGEALPEAVRGGGSISMIRVVSDDVEWCRTRLDEALRSYAEVVHYVPPTDSPQANFTAVSTSQRLIGTNSTFSYWAGYVSNVLYGPSSQVVMPWFHARHMDQGRAYQLDPEWTIIRDIPGGWNA
jgi:hypothetical protein